jgi:predicted dehydrogenase
MSDRLRVGIAGLGVVGRRRREVIDSHPALQTVAVCDRTFGGEGTLDDGVSYFSDYRRLLDEKLDMLFVCLSNDVAAQVTIAGLEAGLHVFCEKPPGRDLKDVERVIVCERRHPGLKLKYGFNHRYHDSVRDALAIHQSNKLGRLINLRGVYGKSTIINFEADWRTQRAIAGGGILLDQGIHMVDLLRLFSGEFVEYHSFVSSDFWRHDVEDNAYALMRTDDGIVAMLHSTATQWRHRFHLEMSFAEGTILLSGLLTGSKSYGAETMTVASRQDNDQGDPHEQTTRYNSDPSWSREVVEFVEAVSNDQPIVNGTSNDALKTMQTVYQIYCADPVWRDRHNLTNSLSKDNL